MKRPTKLVTPLATPSSARSIDDELAAAQRRRSWWTSERWTLDKLLICQGSGSH
jgi:hypothetical protein